MIIMKFDMYTESSAYAMVWFWKKASVYQCAEVRFALWNSAGANSSAYVFEKDFHAVINFVCSI